MKHEHSTRRPVRWLIAAGTMVLAASTWAAEPQILPVNAPAQTAEAEANAFVELDEVMVQGERLFDRIVKAEDQFFKLYNELNKNNDFDTHCAFLTLDTDSHIEQRVCMPSFYADAKAEQVRLNMACASQTAYTEPDPERNNEVEVLSHGACYEPPNAELIFFAQREDYVKNVLKVIDSDPRLQKMAADLDVLHRERDALSHRYDDLRAEKEAERAAKAATRYRSDVRR